MKFFFLLTLFAFFHSLFVLATHSDYYTCFGYSSYYYFYNSNGARCCYRYSYRSSYQSTYYVYCPYYTYATNTAPAATTATSISNYCIYYYYSYYYSSTCCYKNVTAYNAHYLSNYHYYISDCFLPSTTIPSPSSCYYYYYSSYYGTKCCAFYDYSHSSNYDQYCPSRSNLSSQCGTSCCTAYAPVYNGYDTFYYPQYFCPNVHSIYSYCGPFCGMAIAFGIMGYCFCICGLGFAIASFVFCGLLTNDKVKKHSNKSTYIVEHQPPPQVSAGLQGNTEDPHPQFHHVYTHNPNPVNIPYPPQADTQVIFNPAVVPTYFEANNPI